MIENHFLQFPIIGPYQKDYKPWKPSYSESKALADAGKRGALAGGRFRFHFSMTRRELINWDAHEDGARSRDADFERMQANLKKIDDQAYKILTERATPFPDAGPKYICENTPKGEGDELRQFCSSRLGKPFKTAAEAERDMERYGTFFARGKVTVEPGGDEIIAEMDEKERTT